MPKTTAHKTAPKTGPKTGPKQTRTRDVFDKLADQDDQENQDKQDESVLHDAPDAADAEPESDDAREDSATPVRSRSGVRRRVVVVAVGVLLIGLAGLSGFLGWRVKQLDDTAAAGQAALEAARNYVVNLTTLDAKQIDKHYQLALDGATGRFKDEYAQGSAHLRQILIDNQATGKGIVIDAAVKSATTTRVEVLLFVDQSITNAVNPGPRIDRDRVQMTMDLVDDHWLASSVEMA